MTIRSVLCVFFLLLCALHPVPAVARQEARPKAEAVSTNALERAFHKEISDDMLELTRQKKYPGLSDVILAARVPAPVKEDYKEVLAVVHYPQGTGSKAVDLYLARYAEAYFYKDKALEGGPEGASFELRRYPQITTYEATKPSARYISLAFTRYSTGGAHSNWETRVQSYDLKTGKPLEMRDLAFLPEHPGQAFWDAFKLKWKAYLDEKLPAILEKDGDRYSSGKFAEETLDIDMKRIALTKEGLRIIYSPYEIAAYALGTITVDIPLEDLVALDVNTALWSTPKAEAPARPEARKKRQ